MKDYEISHSLIHLEIINNNNNNNLCKCFLAIQPLSPQLSWIEVSVGGGQGGKGFKHDQNKSRRKPLKSNNQIHETTTATEREEEELEEELEELEATTNNCKKDSRIKLVQLLQGFGTANAAEPIDLEEWILSDNLLRIPLDHAQITSKQFHVLIWWVLEGVALQSFTSLLRDQTVPSPSVVPSSDSTLTPTLLLSQDNMLDWFPCGLDDRYGMDFHISIPAFCPVTRRKLVAVCTGELIGRFLTSP
jgi:hypothetical protein